MMPSRYRRKPQVAWQTIAGEAVLVNLASGQTLGLNESGGWLWANVEGQALEQVASAFAVRYELPPDDARRDVQEFLDLLLTEGLLTGESS